MPTRKHPALPRPERSHGALARAAWLVSVQSVACTVVASSAAVALGVRSGTAVLVAFGAIGLVDAIGSIALAYHFRHALRHDQLSDRLEKLAHRVVILGLLLVGLGAIVVSAVRLIAGHSGEASIAGTALAAASLLVLAGLSTRKRSLALQVSSSALLADSRLSAIGAMQAGVALVGTAAARWFGWRWADPCAAIVVGLVAMAVAITTWSGEAKQRRWSSPSRRGQTSG